MGAAAHKQLRAGLGVRTTTQTTNTTEHDKAKASVTILDAIRKYQTNYPNERIGVEKGYNPVLFKRAVMEASQEYRCELALSELRWVRYADGFISKASHLLFRRIPTLFVLSMYYFRDFHPNTMMAIHPSFFQ